jgi:hypothetical protein
MKAVEMTGSGKHGKRSSCFPPFPLPLEIALRSHIPAATTTTITFFCQTLRN